MLFSVGDLVVLAVVTLVVMIFRQLDRNNRSLEKVRRYAEKVQVDLDGIVEVRAAEMRDMAIELEVHQQAGREVLKRIQNIDEELNARMGRVIEIETRINEYDGALKTLMEMTTKTQENIGRVKDESDFVDKVGRRIKAVGEQIAAVEERVPKLVGEFDTKNQSQLVAVYRRLSEQVEQTIAGANQQLSAVSQQFEKGWESFVARVDAAADRFEQRAQAYQDSFAAVERDFKERLERVAAGGTNLETESLKSLVSHFERSLATAKHTLSADLETFSADFLDRRRQLEVDIARLSDTVNEIRNELNIELTDVKTANQNQIGAVRDLVRDRTEQLESSVYSLEQDIAGRISEVRDQANSMVDSLLTTINLDVDNKTDSLRSAIDQRVEALHAGADSAQAQVHRMFAELQEQVEGWTRSATAEAQKLSAQVDELLATAQQLRNENQQTLHNHIENTLRVINESESTVNRRLEDIDSKGTAAVDHAQSLFAAVRDDVTERADATRSDLVAAVNEMRVTTERELSQARTTVGEETQSLRTDLVGELDTLRKEFRETVDVVEGDLVAGRSTIEAIRADQQTAIQQHQQAAVAANTDVKQRLEEQLLELNRHIDQRSDTVERSVLTTIENRIAQYESAVGYRIDKIEEISREMDRLEANLRQLMERMAARIRDDFTAFGKDLQAERLAEAASAKNDMDALRAEMQTVEQSLNDLKTRAYANVGEKLQVFEDDFFRDLHTRSAKIEQSIGDWQNSVNERLETMATAAETERASVEEQYAQQLRQRLADLQAKVMSHTGKIEGQVGSFEESLGVWLGEFEKRVEGTSEELNRRIEQVQQESVAQSREALTRQQTTLTGEITLVQKSLQNQLAQVKTDVDDYQVNMDGVLESVRADVTNWQAGVLRDFESSKNDVANQFAGFRVETATLLSDLRESLAKQKDDLVTGSQEERKRLRNEISDLAGKVEKFTEHLNSSTETALDRFNRDYENFQETSEKRNRDVQNEADSKLREFRSFVVDLREQFDGMQKRLFTKLEDDVRVLDHNLKEIDKRQRSFIAQTKIFERADALKTELNTAIETLKAELVGADQHRKDLKEFEQNFLRVKRLGDETNERMNKFLAEKRRIDALEDDYRRLISLSQSVEVKMQALANDNDRLQAMQVNFRRLEEIEKEVEVRYSRLEKRNDALEATSEGIDRNFGLLHDIETRVAAVAGDLDQMPPRLDDIGGKIARLVAGRKEADLAIKQLGTLEATMTDIENRIKEMQTARDWLSRTETRLEQVAQDADAKVNLLGSLLREEVKTERAVTGDTGKAAPPMSSRDMVIKLARQGWKVDEIGRATKLSRGEIELILEMIHK